MMSLIEFADNPLKQFMLDCVGWKIIDAQDLCI